MYDNLLDFTSRPLPVLSNLLYPKLSADDLPQASHSLACLIKEQLYSSISSDKK